MCEPATLALAATAASTAVQTFGAIQSAQAQKKQASFRAAVARNNAIINQQRADDTRKRGEAAELAHDRRVSQLIGRQRAVLGSSGADVTGADFSGGSSALDIIGDTAELGELDKLTIRGNFEREARDFELAGDNATTQSILFQSQSDSISPFLDGTTSLLSGASTLSDKWFVFSQAGAI